MIFNYSFNISSIIFAPSLKPYSNTLASTRLSYSFQLSIIFRGSFFCLSVNVSSSSLRCRAVYPSSSLNCGLLKIPYSCGMTLPYHNSFFGSCFVPLISTTQYHSFPRISSGMGENYQNRHNFVLLHHKF